MRPGGILRALATFSLLIASAAAFSDEIQGKVIGVSDGDTVTVVDARRVQSKVRISGIDAPEKHQSFGQAAKRKMSDLAYNRDVIVRWSKRDRYSRIVGIVLVDGKDVGLALIEAGLAWHYKRFANEQSASERAAYAAAEMRARAGHIGLWRDTQPVPPWEYRNDKRHHVAYTP
jgi:endonuclease YncB( thermonuclease family)